tara:strand:+ start:4555 stop:6621 length:2067 start_codon:yes stop_codon:yes gene_type:complete
MNLIISATDQASSVLKGINGNVDKLDGKVKGANSKWSGMKKAIGAAAIAAGAFAAVKIVGDKINDMDALAKSARKAGAASSGEAFQGFQVLGQAMEEAGINAATYERALLNTTTKLKMGTEGQKSFASITDKMGDSILKANGELKTGPDLLVAMTNALNAGTITMEDFSKVVGGKAGPEIAAQFASLNTNAEDLQATLDDVAANTNIVPLDAANNAEAFNDTVGRLKNSFGQLFTDALTPLMPVLADLAENILAAMPGIIDTISGALEKMKPLWKIIGVLFTDVIVPILGTLFDILGKVFDVIMPLYEKALPKLETAISTVKDVIQKIVDKITSAITAIKDFKDTVSEMAGGVKDKISDMASSVTSKFDDMTGGMLTKAGDAVAGVTGWFGSMYDTVVGNSIVPDMVDDILTEFDRQSDGMINKTKDAVDGSIVEYDRLNNHFERNQAVMTIASRVLPITQAKRQLKEYNTQLTEMNEANEVNLVHLDRLEEAYANGSMSLNDIGASMDYFGLQSDSAMGKAVSLQGALISGFDGMASGITDTFFNMFTGVTSAFDGLKSIAKMIFSMVAKAMIQIFIVKPLINALTGGLGGIFGFAGGGLATGGQPAIVGERGPELIVPGSNSRVYSNTQSQGILGGQRQEEPLTVNFNLNAVDTQSGVEFIIENKNIITSVIQDAYQTRGRAGPLG